MKIFTVFLNWKLAMLVWIIQNTKLDKNPRANKKDTCDANAAWSYKGNDIKIGKNTNKIFFLTASIVTPNIFALLS